LHITVFRRGQKVISMSVPRFPWDPKVDELNGSVWERFNCEFEQVVVFFRVTKDAVRDEDEDQG